MFASEAELLAARTVAGLLRSVEAKSLVAYLRTPIAAVQQVREAALRTPGMTWFKGMARLPVGALRIPGMTWFKGVARIPVGALRSPLLVRVPLDLARVPELLRGALRLP